MKSFRKSLQLLSLGLFFILPFIIIVLLGSKVIHILKPLGLKISQAFDLHTIFGEASVLIICILIIFLACVLCGYFIQKGIFTKWSSSIEEQLFIHFPSIQVLKYRMIKNQGSVINEFWQATLIEEEDSFRIAFITDESEDFVTLYIPDAPKIDAGEVRYMKKEKLTHYPISMRDAMGTLYNFGKDLDVQSIINKDKNHL